MEHTQKWRRDIKHHLIGIDTLPTKIERIAHVIKIYTLVNDFLDENELVFIEHCEFSILSIVMFMKIITLRVDIQHYPFANAAEQKITKAALQILSTVEGKLRILLKKIKNRREYALLRGYCPDKLERLLA